MTVDPATPTAARKRAPFPPVEDLCRIAHDAYERAAAENGWATQPASRVPWDDVPEANKATMRAAMGAVWGYVCDDVIAPIRRERDSERAVSAGLRAEVERLRAALAAAQPTKETTSADDVAEFAAEVERRGRASFQTGAEPTP